ncbi:Lrp/AsnC family transcriptional regulator, partial [Gluconobacter japonicus]|uniref:Lrp/AsnC family transcriptional regulator n=1 Tax=Gluconobacter japonicus TaxID=376620 RepID=UPI000795B1B9
MKESSSPDLDAIDRKILQLLQGNGRMSNAELAERVNVSAATCHRRTQRLFQEGYGSSALFVMGIQIRCEADVTVGQDAD